MTLFHKAPPLSLKLKIHGEAAVQTPKSMVSQVIALTSFQLLLYFVTIAALPVAVGNLDDNL